MLELKGEKKPQHPLNSPHPQFSPFGQSHPIPCVALLCPSLGGRSKERSRWGEPHQREPLRKGRVSLPLPSATVPSPQFPHLPPAKSIA